MRILKYIPLQLLIFQITGILMGYYLNIPLNIFLPFYIGAFIILIIIYYTYRLKPVKDLMFTAVALILFTGVGIASVLFRSPQHIKGYYSRFLKQDDTRLHLVVTDILKPNDYYLNLNARVASVNAHPSKGRIRVSILKDSGYNEKIAVGSELLALATVETIDKPLNPDQFDFGKYLEKQGIYYQLTLNSHNFEFLSAHENSIKRVAYHIRERMVTALSQNGFKDQELAVVQALLLGQRQDISKETVENYQKAGAVHILALSGLHIGILLLMFNFFLKPLEKLKYGKILKLVLVVIFLWLFAILAGMSSSIVRAVTMFTAVAVGLATGKTTSTYQSLIMSMFFLLLINPFYIFDVGFQLSYLAVFFIVWLQPVFMKLWYPQWRFTRYFWQLFTVSIAAQLGTLPLSLYYFHQFPGLFFISNLIIIPFLGVILFSGILILLLALAGSLPPVFAQGYEFMIETLNKIVALIAGHEDFIFRNIAFSGLALILSYNLIVWFFKWIELKKVAYLKITLISMAFLQGYLLFSEYRSHQANGFIIFNKTGESILAIRKGQKLDIDHSIATDRIEKESFLKGYIDANNVHIDSVRKPVKNYYQVNKEQLLVVDSLGIYDIPGFQPDMVLLTQSPVINLERLISRVKPSLIIADASNYKNRVAIWRKTCEKYNIQFYYTVKEGAFIKEF